MLDTRYNLMVPEVNKAREQIIRVTDKAQQDLLDAISCIQVSLESDRKDYLLDCAEEFMLCAIGKLRLAKRVSDAVRPCETTESPEVKNGKDLQAGT
jgi:hypothetical protein